MGTTTHVLSFRFLCENHVPVIPISFRNRFLTFAPAIAGGYGTYFAAIFDGPPAPADTLPKKIWCCGGSQQRDGCQQHQPLMRFRAPSLDDGRADQSAQDDDAPERDGNSITDAIIRTNPYPTRPTETIRRPNIARTAEMLNPSELDDL
jgi:hypothetical protein